MLEVAVGVFLGGLSLVVFLGWLAIRAEDTLARPRRSSSRLNQWHLMEEAERLGVEKDPEVAEQIAKMHEAPFGWRPTDQDIRCFRRLVRRARWRRVVNAERDRWRRVVSAASGPRALASAVGLSISALATLPFRAAVREYRYVLKERRAASDFTGGLSLVVRVVVAFVTGLMIWSFALSLFILFAAGVTGNL